jgi:hypothetical protein
MAQKLRYVGWFTLLFSSAVLGCTKAAVQQKSVPDPLLLTKPPVEGRPHTAQASPIYRSEPTPTPPAPAE